jgi:hypothetical protein
MYKPTCCYTIEQIKQRNESAGFHFFERSTMRFFRSRIAPGVYHAGKQDLYNLFVTSEQFDASSPRLYTVRQMEDDGSIESLSTFQAYRSLRAARAAIKRFAETGEPFA